MVAACGSDVDLRRELSIRPNPMSGRSGCSATIRTASSGRRKSATSDHQFGGRSWTRVHRSPRCLARACRRAAAAVQGTVETVFRQLRRVRHQHRLGTLRARRRPRIGRYGEGRVSARRLSRGSAGDLDRVRRARASSGATCGPRSRWRWSMLPILASSTSWPALADRCARKSPRRSSRSCSRRGRYRARSAAGGRARGACAPAQLPGRPGGRYRGRASDSIANCARTASQVG